MSGPPAAHNGGEERGAFALSDRPSVALSTQARATVGADRGYGKKKGPRGEATPAGLRSEGGMTALIHGMLLVGEGLSKRRI